MELTRTLVWSEDAAGNLYGTTQGNGYIDGAAVVFKVDPNGQETSLDIAGPNACCFDSPLALDAKATSTACRPSEASPIAVGIVTIWAAEPCSN